ncbi:helix-turn-helix transcriptional regulator [Arthrobacter sp.]|uniref:helix-turn-helix transcriptional regulator n=1 Tax=Arthrobacter sp. TaxID=1667 RepID=UPI003A8F4E80
MTATIPEWATDIVCPQHDDDLTWAKGPTRTISTPVEGGEFKCTLTMDWDDSIGVAINLNDGAASILLTAAQARQVADEIHKLLDIDQPRAAEAAASPSPDDLLTVPQVAALTGLTTSTLANWRSAGTGPTPTHVGGRVRYLRHELNAWLNSQTGH